MSLPALPSLDARRYAETFAVFLEHSLEYDLMAEEIERVIRHNLDGPLRMLDIGAGTGCVIERLSRQPTIRLAYYEAFEPNPKHLSGLKSVLAHQDFPHRWHEEGFSEATPISGPFDFVLFSHSLYWMPDPAAAMRHAAAALSPGGVAMALIQGPYGAHALFSLFEEQYRRLTPMLQNNRISSHELVAGLRAAQVEPEVHMLRTPIDMTELLDGCHPIELSEFISFLLQLEFSALPHRLQGDIVRYIDGGCVETDGRLLWYLPNASVLITRADS